MDTQYLKRVGIFVLSAILSVGIVLYFGYHIWHSFTREIETQAATQVTYTQTVETEGYIFRTETLLDASSAKSVVPTAAEGEHIRKGGQVAKLYSEYSPDTVARIAEIEEQIELLTRYSKAGGMSLKDTSSIDREIYSVLADMRGLADSGSVGDASALRQSFVGSIGERAVLTGSFNDIDGQIAKLNTEKNSLTAELGSMLGNVSTPVSGYYYSVTDGYENVFRSELLEDISLRELRDLLKAEPQQQSNTGKTVTKSRWNMVCMAEETEKNTYKAGETCTVKFKNTDISVTMDVEQVLYDDDNTALILSTNYMPEGFDFSRVQDVELEKAEFTGLKVPISAVRLINGETGVYILDVTTVSFRKVEIIFTAEDDYIVKIAPEAEEPEEGEEKEDENKGDTPYLRLHDSIIVEGKGLYEGRVIGN